MTDARSTDVSRPLKVALLGDMVTVNLPRLREKAEFPVEALCVPNAAPAAERDAAIRAADAAVVTAFPWPATDARGLRLVQVQGAGWEKVDVACLPASTTVCNAFGHVRAAAEYALMTMLMWTHRWKEVEDSFRGGSWRFGGSSGGPLRDELNTRTVGIVGLGHMGREIADRLHALDIRVLGCARRAPEGLASVEHVYALEHLDAFLSQCDFVILAIALAPETTGLIDAQRLARMRPGAVLVNLARGPVVNERALYEALVAKTIAGAVIDVWWVYPSPQDPNPRPSAYPFHELPNVMMTPHSSQWTEPMMDRRWDMIVSNLRRLHRGEPLHDVVRAGA
ncbi:MAG: 2-hydroxyacid dehydrogenase [Burkholderiales bacterium]|jgi:phosphoglycerate dehydrogenase-like enzyme